MRHTPARELRLVKCQETLDMRLRVAIATEDLQAVNAPFGRTAAFAIFEVAAEKSELVACIEFEAPPIRRAAANDNPDGCTPRLEARFEALEGCHVLFVSEISDLAAGRAMRRNIHPLVVPERPSIASLLSRCQAMLATNPPPWLRRVVSGGAAPALDICVAGAFAEKGEDE